MGEGNYVPQMLGYHKPSSNGQSKYQLFSNPPLCYLVCLRSVPSPFLYIYMSACELHFLCATRIFRKDNHPNLNTLPRKAVWRDIIMFKRTMG